MVEFPAGGGGWVYVCGPSGAGKDSVIAWAARELWGDARVFFGRRLITRPAHPESDHEPSSPQRFDELLAGGGLAWHWTANGVRYGVPVAWRHMVQAGSWVVVNGSRAHLEALRSPEPLRVVHVNAPTSQLAARLQARGRDDHASIARRMQEALRRVPSAVHCEIVNDGALDAAGRQLADYLRGLASDTSITG